jgi:signal transduction histidine kinase
MRTQVEVIAAEGTGFQGRITASVSHEINNVLATISETAGLLADLIELAGTGRALDTEELRDCAGTIVDEVRRGFHVVKNLNRFAHSADEPVAEVDLGDLVTLVAGLAGYLSYSSSVDLRRSEGTGPRLTTRPLLLENLVYRVFVNAFKKVGPNGTVEVTTESTGEGGRIVFSDAGSLAEDEEIIEIAGSLDCRVEADGSRDELFIMVPRSIDSPSIDVLSDGSGQ